MVTTAASTDPTGQGAHAAQAGATRGTWGASALYAWATTLFGVIGLFMSGLIMYDKIKLMEDPDFSPACTINDVVSCTDVMNSGQASAFGIPNPFIGLVGFSVVICIGVALLAGARFRAWFLYGFLAGLAFAVGFVHWLAYEALYDIQALCPYCMVVWAVVLPLFITTVVGIGRARARDRGDEVTTGASALFGMPLIVLVVWYLGFLALILQQFVF